MSLGYLNDHGDWHMNEEEIDDRGWNNQFLTFDLLTRRWQNPKTTGAVPCPRAAHSMCLLGNRAYLFGGRSSPRRLNDLYFLDLNALQWTQLQLSGDIPWWVGIILDLLVIMGDFDCRNKAGYSQDEDKNWKLKIKGKSIKLGMSMTKKCLYFFKGWLFCFSSIHCTRGNGAVKALILKFSVKW